MTCPTSPWVASSPRTRFALQVQRHADRQALRMGPACLSYSELADRTYRVAHAILARRGDQEFEREGGMKAVVIERPHEVSWRDIDVPQCGYCQSGQIMAAAALLATKPNPSDSDIDREMTNICRCGTYRRIRMAIHRAAELSKRA